MISKSRFLVVQFILFSFILTGQKLLVDAPSQTTEVFNQNSVPQNTYDPGQYSTEIRNNNEENLYLGTSILYDNGPFITHHGIGLEGSNYSMIMDLSDNIHFPGYGCMIGESYYNYSVVEDFVVDEEWHISSFTFYAYQKLCSPPSSLTDVRYRILDGDPREGGSVIYGNMLQNTMLSTQWTNTWRVFESGIIYDSPIMEIVAESPDLVLAPGTYWIEWQLGGTCDEGPWAPPIAIIGQENTGNALQNSSSFGYQALTDYAGATQGLPFLIEGFAGDALSNDMAVSQILTPGTGFGLNSETVSVMIQNYGTTEQNGFEISYSISENTPVFEVVNVSIPPGESLVYTFDTKAYFTGIRKYDIEVCVHLEGDEKTDNDCFSKEIINKYGVKVSPKKEDDWTGSLSPTEKTEYSLVNASGASTESGWMKFDISAIPEDAVIKNITFYGYVYETTKHPWVLTPLWKDPVVTNPTTLWNDIVQGSDLEKAYFHKEYDARFYPGWHSYELSDDAKENMMSSLDKDWFAMGVFLGSSSSLAKIKFEGWDEDHSPYLVVELESPEQPKECENFDSLTTGTAVAENLKGFWTTGKGMPGTDFDAIVSDDFSSNDNAFLISGQANLLLQFGYQPISKGFWQYSHNMYVPAGSSGSFLIQTDHNSGHETNVKLVFNEGGTGTISGQTSENFTFEHDNWLNIDIRYNFQNNQASIMLDGELISAFTNQLPLGGVRYFTSAEISNSGVYYDDVCFSKQVHLPPFDLEASLVGSNDVQLIWKKPLIPSVHSLKWHNDEFHGAIGFLNVNEFSVAARFDPVHLEGYDGMILRKMSFFPHVKDVVFRMTVWSGDNAENVETIEIVDEYTKSEFNEVIFSNPVTIDASKPLWIGYKAYCNPCLYLVGRDSGPAIPYYGDLLSYDEEEWLSLYYHHTFNYNWLFTGYVTNSDDPSVFFPLDGKSRNSNQSSGHTKIDKLDKDLLNSSFSDEPIAYNIYRNDVFLKSVSDTTYLDEDLSDGIYRYYVSAVYDGGESLPTNVAIADIAVGVQWILENNFVLSPNPSTGMIYIDSEFEIHSITVYNQVGQIESIFTTEAKKYSLDLQDYSPGVYLIQLESDHGKFNKRIVLH